MRKQTIPQGSLLLCLVISACAEPKDDEFLPVCLEAVEVARFGHAELVHEGLEDRARGVEGGVLGDIRGVTVAPNGSLWVLDRSWYKIVAFRPDGSVERVVLGGRGQGPGEFQLPIHIAATETGVSILDYELRRTTRFDWNGTFEGVASVPTPAPFRHVVRGDTVWIAPGGGRPTTESILFGLDVDGNVIRSGPILDPRDQPYGAGLGLVVNQRGELLMLTARPGVWMAERGGAWVRIGSPLFPDDRPPLEERIETRLTQITPSQYTASGLGLVGDSMIVQGYLAFSRPFDWVDPPGRDDVSYWLALFDREGSHLSSLQLPPATDATYLYVDPSSGRLFVRSMEPFPQVVELGLEICSGAIAET